MGVWASPTHPLIHHLASRVFFLSALIHFGQIEIVPAWLDFGYGDILLCRRLGLDLLIP